MSRHREFPRAKYALIALAIYLFVATAPVSADPPKFGDGLEFSNLNTFRLMLPLAQSFSVKSAAETGKGDYGAPESATPLLIAAGVLFFGVAQVLKRKRRARN